MTQPRIAGHALRRNRGESGSTGGSWSCECGEQFGALAIRPARLAHREHKAFLTETIVNSTPAPSRPVVDVPLPDEMTA